MRVHPLARVSLIGYYVEESPGTPSLTIAEQSPLEPQTSTFFRDLEVSDIFNNQHICSIPSRKKGSIFAEHGPGIGDREKAQIFRGADAGTFIMDSGLCAEQRLCADDAGAGYGDSAVDGK